MSRRTPEASAASAPATPGHDCPLCPRLAAFREEARRAEPGWFNGPVPTFGAPAARLLVVGLAPGLRGANRTGRAFTGDHAGELLYATLQAYGFAEGTYDRRIDDGLILRDCAITNTVRCVPPQNKPTPAEIQTCRTFMRSLLASMGQLKAMVVLGRIAHESTMRAFGIKLTAMPFRHGARHVVARGDATPVVVHDSYHCSRYNTSTGLLTPAMFQGVFAAARADLEASPEA